MATGTLKQLYWSGDTALIRHHLNEDEIIALYVKFHSRKHKHRHAITDGLVRQLSYFSAVQLGSIVSCQDLSLYCSVAGTTPEVLDMWLGMLRIAALLEIKDTRILTSLSVHLENGELRELTLQRLKVLVDGKKRIEELSKEIKAKTSQESSSF